MFFFKNKISARTTQTGTVQEAKPWRSRPSEDQLLFTHPNPTPGSVVPDVETAWQRFLLTMRGCAKGLSSRSPLSSRGPRFGCDCDFFFFFSCLFCDYHIHAGYSPSKPSVLRWAVPIRVVPPRRRALARPGGGGGGGGAGGELGFNAMDATGKSVMC